MEICENPWLVMLVIYRPVCYLFTRFAQAWKKMSKTRGEWFEGGQGQMNLFTETFTELCKPKSIKSVIAVTKTWSVFNFSGEGCFSAAC